MLLSIYHYKYSSIGIWSSLPISRIPSVIFGAVLWYRSPILEYYSIHHGVIMAEIHQGECRVALSKHEKKGIVDISPVHGVSSRNKGQKNITFYDDIPSGILMSCDSIIFLCIFMQSQWFSKCYPKNSHISYEVCNAFTMLL